MIPIFATRQELDALAAGRKVLRDETREIHIFGAGHVGRRVLDKFRDENHEPAGFLDSNPELQGRVVSGLTVESPQTLARRNPGAIIVLAAACVDELAEVCGRLGFAHTLTPAECVRRYGLAATFEKIQASADARRAVEIWDDSQSRDTYTALLRVWAGLDMKEHPGATPSQYFVPGIIDRADLHSFIDCGALDGDVYGAVRYMTDNGFAAYYAFEPDAGPYAILEKTAGMDSRVQPYAIALGDGPGRARFAVSQRGWSHVSETGAVEVEVNSIDNILSGCPVSMIKMDIEGSELAALRGAEDTIRKYTPALAICNYHSLEQLWEVPLWIHDLGLGYRLFLRHHSAGFAETVCYAVAGHPPIRT